ncbi:MarR family winged helix-turn-helix transcriptional regulator [Streptomyces sp. NPDC020597]|uniref:MarR family winged helix-turn-helix transcriptional regulator n=1 Tax=unclassified Streptomyces TaxID=2593676 RepID=UPI0037A846CD
MTASDRPIGYWLKHLDNLLERHFEAALADLGLDRRQWQVLNTLASGGLGRAALQDALAPFWTADGPGAAEVLARLAVRGWLLDGPGDGLALTEAGRTAHTDVLARVKADRAVVVTGLTGEQYTQTLRVLSVMAGNVEAALAAR